MTTETYKDRVPAARTATKVSDAMSEGVIRCAPQTPLRKVAQLMTAHNIHAVYVFDYGSEDDESAQIWGLVSDLDIVAAWPVVDRRTAGNSMVTPLVTVAADQPLEQAAQLMAEKNSTHLAVIDPATGRPVGVLSTLDVAGVIAAGPPTS